MNETELIILRSTDKSFNQRSLAQKLGFSIGKTNYILKGLIGKGYIKAERFINSENKAQYRYLLTPAGVKERVRLTEAFIQRKKQEYEELQKDLEQLRKVADV